jgi:hypothetical protein
MVFVWCRAGAWAAYNRLLAKQPMFTKALTSLSGFTIGDILAQSVRVTSTLLLINLLYLVSCCMAPLNYL